MSKKIERFEDFIAWQKLRQLSRKIYQATNLPGFSRDFGLKDQIRRSAISIMSNIAEGFERGGAAEFRQFLSIAKASCAELRSQLYVAFDAHYISQSSISGIDVYSDGSWADHWRLASGRRKAKGFSLIVFTHHSSLITRH